jgi:hypothetical protein
MLVSSEDKKWYRVSLRLLGDYLPVDDVQERLNLVPSRIGKKGDYLNLQRQGTKYSTNLWVSEYLTGSEISFGEQIGVLLDILELRIDDLREILSLPDVKGELFLGFSSGNGQGGDYFSHYLLQRIVNCGLSLSLDLYPAGLNEEELIHDKFSHPNNLDGADS